MLDTGPGGYVGEKGGSMRRHHEVANPYIYSIHVETKHSALREGKHSHTSTRRALKSPEDADITLILSGCHGPDRSLGPLSLDLG